MLLVSSCVPVITWLCSRVMQFQSRPINWPLLTIESPVAQWLEHLTRSRGVVGSNPIWGSDVFRVLQTFNISCVCCFIFIIIINNYDDDDDDDDDDDYYYYYTSYYRIQFLLYQCWFWGIEIFMQTNSNVFTVLL